MYEKSDEYCDILDPLLLSSSVPPHLILPCTVLRHMIQTNLLTQFEIDAFLITFQHPMLSNLKAASKIEVCLFH